MTTKELVSEIVKNNPDWGYKRVASAAGISYTSARYYMNDAYRAGVHVRRKALSRKRMRDLRLAMGGKCSICGYDKCLEALQFHHKDSSQKEFEIADAVRGINSFDLDKVMVEVQKCDLVCANCHVEIHVNQ